MLFVYIFNILTAPSFLFWCTMNKYSKSKQLESLVDLYILYLQYKKNRTSILEAQPIQETKERKTRKRSDTEIDVEDDEQTPKKRKKRTGVYRRRNVEGFYSVTFLKMKQNDPKQLFNQIRLTVDVFNQLVELCAPYLTKNCVREPLAPEFRIALTLSYLTQGTGVKALSNIWKVGKETVRHVVYETCEIIWTVLSKEYVKEPTTGDLYKIAENYWDLWKVPNCLGAIDGRHIVIAKPHLDTEAYAFNNKTYSIVMLGICDASYKFSYVDIVPSVPQGDGGIFQASNIGKRLITSSMPIPPPKNLPGSDKILPHFYVANSSIPLHPNVMKTYAGDDVLGTKTCYNSRLLRAHQTIDNAFGVLAARWKVILTTLYMYPDNAKKIVLACVALHNFILLHNNNRDLYIPECYTDWADDEGILHPGMWRDDIEKSLFPLGSSQSRHVYNKDTSTLNRDQLSMYFYNEGKL